MLGKAPGQSIATVRSTATSQVVQCWRRLTGGRVVRDHARRTLIGCSGGADSSALAIALASVSDNLVVAHVLHDLRPREQALADAAAAAGLAAMLGLPYRQSEVRVRTGTGNAEARARVARYAALEVMALEAHCPFVAVGHQRDDQAETIMMGLLRGAGPRGLAGVSEQRPLGRCKLIRPLLKVTRSECRTICQRASWDWQEDQTNADRDLFRAEIRHGLLPAAEALRPGASRRIAAASLLMRDVCGLLMDRVGELWAARKAESKGECVGWDRGLLRAERPVVLGELLRMAAGRLAGGRGLDRMGTGVTSAIVRAIKDDEVRSRKFHAGDLAVEVRSKAVRLSGRRADG